MLDKTVGHIIDTCTEVYVRTEGWMCEEDIPYDPPLFSNEQILDAGIIALGVIILLWWCAYRGRKDGEEHGPRLD